MSNYPVVEDGATGEIKLVGGKFTDADPVTNTPASKCRAKDINQLFDENNAVTVWGGGVPDEANAHQVRDAIIAGVAAMLNANDPNTVINGSCRMGQLTGGRPQANLSTSYQYAGVDRWAGAASGGAVTGGTIQQEATTLLGTSGYAFSFLGVTLTGSGELTARYRFESSDVRKYKNIAAIIDDLKIYHDAGVNVNYKITISKANSQDNFSAVTAIANSGNIAVATGVATALSFSTAPGDCSNGIEIKISAACGAIVNKNFRFTELQQRSGSTVKTILDGTFAETSLKCARYYQKGGVGIGCGGTNTTTVRWGIAFGVPMRTTPTGISLLTGVSLRGATAHSASGGAWAFSELDAGGADGTLSGFTDTVAANPYVVTTASVVAFDAEL